MLLVNVSPVGSSLGAPTEIRFRLGELPLLQKLQGELIMGLETIAIALECARCTGGGLLAQLQPAVHPLSSNQACDAASSWSDSAWTAIAPA